MKRWKKKEEIKEIRNGEGVGVVRERERENKKRIGGKEVE